MHTFSVPANKQSLRKAFWFGQFKLERLYPYAAAKIDVNIQAIVPGLRNRRSAKASRFRVSFVAEPIVPPLRVFRPIDIQVDTARGRDSHGRLLSGLLLPAGYSDTRASDVSF